jgi:hypothetical protein
LVPTQFIFRWSGQPLGYVHADSVYDFHDRCLGLIERDGSVWGLDGHYLGELVESSYILRNTTRLPPQQKPGWTPPLKPVSPPAWRPGPRMPRVPRVNWIDSF